MPPCGSPSSTGRVRAAGWAWAVIAVMAAWTVATTIAYARPARRAPLLLSADLAVTVAMHAQHDRCCRIPSPGRTGRVVTATWMAGPVLAWAISVRQAGGHDRGTDRGLRRFRAAARRGAQHRAQRGGAACALGMECRPPGPAERRAGGTSASAPPRSKRQAESGNASPATSTTRCCRCLPSCSGAAPKRAARQPNSDGWPASRRPRCGRWSGGPGRAAGQARGEWTCASWSRPAQTTG